MARTGWGASEGRLILNTIVKFEEGIATEAEELVGPAKNTRVISAKGGAATFVSFEGAQEVTFTSGGWCVQRTLGADKESEGLLRFWLDCPSGATKGDVTIDAGERIFFSTGVYDDAAELKRLAEQRDALATSEADAEAQRRKLQKEADEGNLLAKVAAFRAKVTAEDERMTLRYQRQFFERLPGLGLGPAAITVGPGQCGLSVKRQSGSPGLFGRSSVYHILGRYEMEPLLHGEEEEGAEAVG